MWLAWLLAACTGAEDKADSGTVGSSLSSPVPTAPGPTPTPTAPTPDLVLSPATVLGAFLAPSVAIQGLRAEADHTFDRTALSRDLAGEPVGLGEGLRAELLELEGSPEGLVDSLICRAPPGTPRYYAELDPAGTAFRLSDLRSEGLPLDPRLRFRASEDSAFRLVLSRERAGRLERVSAMILVPGVGAPLDARFTDESFVLTGGPSLVAAPTAGVVEGTAPRLTWSDLTETWYGGPWVASDVRRVVLARLASSEPEAVSAALYQLESRAEASYVLEVAGVAAAATAEARSAEGLPFSGFVDPGAGVWIVALYTDCPLPLPAVAAWVVPG